MTKPAAKATSARPLARILKGAGLGLVVAAAVGAYAGGLNVRDEAFAGLFARPPLAGALGRGRVHAVGWRSLTHD